MDKKTLDNLIDKWSNNSITIEEKEILMNYYNSYQFSTEWDNTVMGNPDEIGDRLFKKMDIGTPLATPTKNASFWKPLYRVAAAAILFFCLSWVVYTAFFEAPTYLIVETGKETKDVVLPDGTKVTMNVNSKLSYPKRFENHRRDVIFEGEGFFEVKSDSMHPFVVATPQMKVRVLGTAFNLKAYADDPLVETSLLHGKVEVLSKDEKYTYSTLEPLEKFVFEKVSVDKAGLTEVKPQMEVLPVQFIDQANTAPVDVAWKEGKFAFISTTFTDVAREIKRRYGVELVFLNKEVAAYKYSASFEQESVEEILHALNLVKSFSYRKEGDRIVIY
ncbi:FecR family protein [Sphingobacterium tabacisoli]|uniref:FecR family protein n=1 Tax=Sphingobacterium tabacisoli TaxID=2044855 RepID=A0ABW5L658_9SPHI|nr:FecR domain-containing protein [Sphingobacterium tabacisoli]